MANDSKKTENKKGQINIELDEAIAQGTYSNLAIINHSVSEFVVDFVNIMPSDTFISEFKEYLKTLKNISY